MITTYEIRMTVKIPTEESDDPYGYIRGEIAMLRQSFTDMHVTKIQKSKPRRNGGTRHAKKKKSA